jgi:hypothetical protein
MRVAEYVLDTRLFHRCRNHIVRNWLSRQTNIDDTPCGADQVKYGCSSFRIAAALENNIRAPASVFS